MVSKESARQDIAKLIEKFRTTLAEGKLKDYNEGQTKKDFIEPLFEALGWDVDSEDVKVEEKVSRDRVDYAFRLGGITKFLVEAKKLSADLEDVEHAKQVLKYAWNKDVVWAVLTNFESLKIFNAQWKAQNISQNRFIELKWDCFLDKFDKLWLLSTESIQNGELNKEAEEVSKTIKKLPPIGSQLFEDFNEIRRSLSDNIRSLNQRLNLSGDDIDAAVQKILDRLIFIRVCEDKGLEEKDLRRNLREWKETGNGSLIKRIRGLFSAYKQTYDSGLFEIEAGLSDQVEVGNQTLEKVINFLYGAQDGSYEYDFSAIDADVLGNIYEQYLGHILKKTEKRVKLTEGKTHRKEQGIYYTPTYIVDFIVKNTIGELVKDKDYDTSKIKVLDPACGSGSFLIKAFDLLYELNEERGEIQKISVTEGRPQTYVKKIHILADNLFGVDLDSKAVEIAQLNLFLKAMEKGQQLPILQKNIKCGNSLIDDPKFSPNAFIWEKEFNEIIEKNKGFDVIIGNPPYGVLFSKEEREYFKTKYPHRDKDINSFVLFIERAYSLLRDNGYLGFIIPKNFVKTDDYEKIRELVLSNNHLTLVGDFGKAFKEVTGEMVVIVLKKNVHPEEKTRIERFDEKLNCTSTLVPQKVFLEFDKLRINLSVSQKTLPLIEKIRSNSIRIGDCLKIIRGVETGKQDDYISLGKKSNTVPIVVGKDIDRYIVRSNRWMDYLPNKIDFKDETIYKKPKLLVRKIADHIHATYDDTGLYTTQGVYCLYGQSIEALKFHLGVLNSRLIHWYYNFYFNMDSNLTTNVTIENIRNIYSKDLIDSNIVKLVNHILSLNERLNVLGNKLTDERKKIEEEIQKTDAEIDELVYKLYGITNEEKKLIEESLK